jgi:hypothetical protein
MITRVMDKLDAATIADLMRIKQACGAGSG